jgi:hypothetical protein
MTMKSFRSIPSIAAGKLMLGALAAAFALTAVAHAQPTFSGTFVLPQEVRWNHAMLPAGEYSIEIRSLNVPAVLYSKGAQKALFTEVPVIDQSGPGGAALRVTVRQGERVVRSLNLPGIGKTLIFEPQTNAERESTALAGHAEAIPVVTAQK